MRVMRQRVHQHILEPRDNNGITTSTCHIIFLLLHHYAIQFQTRRMFSRCLAVQFYFHILFKNNATYPYTVNQEE
jgi:hypothetical protein